SVSWRKTMGIDHSPRPGLGRVRLCTGVWAFALLTGIAAAGEAGQPFDYIPSSPLRNSPPPVSTTVARWHTWLLKTSTELRPAAPPADRSVQTLSELGELRSLQAQRNSITLPAIEYWNSGPATTRWTELA